MKKLLLLIAVLFSAAVVKAGPGDTTWVQANDVQLSWYDNYDTNITFPAPGTSYRKVLMVFTLGKYVCPGSPTYCGDWDYTVQNFVMTPTDTFELGRLITPYANAGAPRTPWSWKQHYIFDVTAYASKLTGPAVMRILYSGYSGGFTGNIRFAFIEGTPERNVVDVKRLWNGSFGYGGGTSINTHFDTVRATAPTGTQNTELKFTVTGHGFDDNGCSEFCSKNYKVIVNGASALTQTIWRNNCGSNELYPQSGTWLYDRGNWCPGAMVYAQHNILPGVTAGSMFSTNLEFENYTMAGTSSSPSYTTEAHLIYWGALNHSVDASLEDIIAPTMDENYFRENAICGKPSIRVRNSGSTTITAMTISYGIAGGTMLTYDWTGSIASMTDVDIKLPEVNDLNYGAGVVDTNTFNVTITSVNGAADEDATNNSKSSRYVNTAAWPLKFRVFMFTNNEASSGSNSETSWKIYDMSDNVVAQRTDALISRSYDDTVSLPSGCYRLEITDLGCNGLYWWANPSGTSGGSFFIKKAVAPGANIPMTGYTTTGTYRNDFGCSFTKYFFTSPWNAGVTEVSSSATGLDVYPNPAQGSVTVDITGADNINGKLRVIDVMGREVMNVPCTQGSNTLNTAALSNGIYTIQYLDVAGYGKLQTRIVIAK